MAFSGLSDPIGAWFDFVGGVMLVERSRGGFGAFDCWNIAQEITHDAVSRFRPSPSMRV